MNKNIIIMILTSITVFVLGLIIGAKFLDKTPYITKLEVFGEEIETQKGKMSYTIHLKEAEIKSVSNGCEIPIKVKMNSNYTLTQGITYYQEGEREIYMTGFINEFHDNDVLTSDMYDLKIKVILEEPLKVAEECQITEE